MAEVMLAKQGRSDGVVVNLIDDGNGGAWVEIVRPNGTSERKKAKGFDDARTIMGDIEGRGNATAFRPDWVPSPPEPKAVSYSSLTVEEQAKLGPSPAVEQPVAAAPRRGRPKKNG